MCTNPSYIVKYHSTLTGEIKQRFFRDKLSAYSFWRSSAHVYEEPIPISCGKCVECSKAISTEWAYRILDECKVHEFNCMIDLTYNDDHFPHDGVSRREMQLFVKSLRDKIKPVKIRFFGCGEYGKRFHRPHYHIIIFGWKPPDMTFFKLSSKGTPIYRSSFVEEIWKKGFSDVTDVTFEAGFYAAKYLNKILPPPPGLNPSFVQMSNRPGIGFACALTHDLENDKIYYRGNFCRIPRYYLKVAERSGFCLDKLKANRLNRAKISERKYSKLLLKNSLDIERLLC